MRGFFMKRGQKAAVGALGVAAALCLGVGMGISAEAALGTYVGTPFGILVEKSQFKMLEEGALLSAQENGIAFSAVLDAEIYEKLLDKQNTEELSFGMVYTVPEIMNLYSSRWTETDVVIHSPYCFTVERKNSWYKEGDFYRYDMAIADIPDNGYEIDFIVRPYIKAGEFYFYGEALTRSMMDAAELALASEESDVETKVFAEEVAAAKLYRVETDEVFGDYAEMSGVKAPTTAKDYPEISYGGGAAAGDKVSITVLEKPEWMTELNGFTVTTTDGQAIEIEKVTDGEYTFTMPESDIVIAGNIETETYTITWKNPAETGKGEDVVLKTDILHYGEMPEYTGAIPQRAETEDAVYTFTGWTPEISMVRGDATYTATYSSTWQDGDMEAESDPEFCLADFADEEYAERVSWPNYGYNASFSTEVLPFYTDKNGVEKEGVLLVDYDGVGDSNENSLQVDLGRPVKRVDVYALTVTFCTVNANILGGGLAMTPEEARINVLLYGYEERFRVTPEGGLYGPWANNRTDVSTVNNQWTTVYITNTKHLDWSMDEDGYIRSIWLETFNSRGKQIYISDVGYIAPTDLEGYEPWTDMDLEENVLSDFNEAEYVRNLTGPHGKAIVNDGVLEFDIFGMAYSYTDIWLGKPIAIDEIEQLQIVMKQEGVMALDQAVGPEVYFGNYDDQETFKPGFYIGKAFNTEQKDEDGFVTFTFTKAQVQSWGNPDELGRLNKIRIMLQGQSGTPKMFIKEIRNAVTPPFEAWKDTNIAEGLLSDFVETEYAGNVSGTALGAATVEKGALKLEYKNVGNVYVDIWFGKPVHFKALKTITFKMRAENLSQVFIAGYDDDIFKGGYYLGTNDMTDGGLTSEWKEFTVAEGDISFWQPYADEEGNIYKCRILVQSSDGNGVLYIDEIRYTENSPFVHWTDSDIEDGILADFNEENYAGNVISHNVSGAEVQDGILDITVKGAGVFSYVDIYLGRIVPVEEINKLKIVMQVKNMPGEQSAYFTNYDELRFVQSGGYDYTGKTFENPDENGWVTFEFDKSNIKAWGNPDENGCLNKIRIMFQDKDSEFTVLIKEIGYTTNSASFSEIWTDNDIADGILADFEEAEYAGNVAGNCENAEVTNGGGKVTVQWFGKIHLCRHLFGKGFESGRNKHSVYRLKIGRYAW